MCSALGSQPVIVIESDRETGRGACDARLRSGLGVRVGLAGQIEAAACSSRAELALGCVWHNVALSSLVVHACREGALTSKCWEGAEDRAFWSIVVAWERRGELSGVTLLVPKGGRSIIGAMGGRLLLERFGEPA